MIPSTEIGKYLSCLATRQYGTGFLTNQKARQQVMSCCPVSQFHTLLWHCRSDGGFSVFPAARILEINPGLTSSSSIAGNIGASRRVVELLQMLSIGAALVESYESFDQYVGLREKQVHKNSWTMDDKKLFSVSLQIVHSL